MYATSDPQRFLVLSYLGLRKMIGIIGIMLPLVLVLGRMIFESPGILDSISAYYYSVMRDVFVGSLCAVAVFLLSYRYDWLDDIAGDFAGVCAIGVAFFPTAPDVGATEQQVVIGELHLLFAACFFLTLAFFALVLFRKTDQQKKPTRQKQWRNMVYLFCGLAILVCIALLVLAQFLRGNPQLQPLHPVFWLESLAIMAFGIAWFVKGETILKDG
jgi:magnesium-transporting ATPase (P-type)